MLSQEDIRKAAEALNRAHDSYIIDEARAAQQEAAGRALADAADRMIMQGARGMDKNAVFAQMYGGGGLPPKRVGPVPRHVQWSAATNPGNMDDVEPEYIEALTTSTKSQLNRHATILLGFMVEYYGDPEKAADELARHMEGDATVQRWWRAYVDRQVRERRQLKVSHTPDNADYLPRNVLKDNTPKSAGDASTRHLRDTFSKYNPFRR